ncbi:2-dehydro-3-deoxygalactonokinase [Novosphingobium sp. TH158]|uniref:2-dehydro-3-deoxygalactonokinase n=1 Tax=Novosphingobium sp. TH158 TaxID=2067455 RepID=UPI000C798D46|nr:2-dehydro-3-deoxygalactonokinase [Novosphingobium sp. TH158]PLK25958.1 2-oxo-3-deoxygalactonate kinase [Novosphingobium sp. TH158]
MNTETIQSAIHPNQNHPNRNRPPLCFVRHAVWPPPRWGIALETPPGVGMKNWSNEFIGVDWGTTNLRAYRIGCDGGIQESFEDVLGVSAVSDGNFAGIVRELRETLGNLPMLLSGMIGSSIGWRTTPYVAAPASLEDIAAKITWVEPRWTGLLPGISVLTNSRADVMRGEEVQLLGYQSEHGLTQYTICHPGTHTKWAKVRGGKVEDFRSVMTGEQFSLLKEHSLLKAMMHGRVEPDRSFLEAVETGWSGVELTAELFTVRANVLLSRLPECRAASTVSGLLIGMDLRTGLRLAGHDLIVVLGDPALVRLYTAAIEHIGKDCEPAEGATAFVAGMTRIKEMIQ